jgi:hypothetical protein
MRTKSTEERGTRPGAVHVSSTDLLAEALLQGEAAREQAHQPGQLRDADDPLVRDVADVREAVEGHAERVKGDRPLDDLADEAVVVAAALGRERG